MRPSGTPSYPNPARGTPTATAGAGANVALPPAAASALDRLAQALKPLAQALASLDDAAGRAEAALRRFADGLGAALDAPGRALAAAMDLVGDQVGGGFRKLLSPLGKVADTAWALTVPFQRLAGSLQPFLQAVNPALAQALSYAIRELVATFGLLITPIAQELVPVIKEVAAALQPVFRALGPILAELTRVLGRVIALLARSFAQVLEAMAPVLTALVELFASLVEALHPVIAAAASLLAALAPLLNSLVKGLTPIFQGLAKAALLLTAAILKTVGATGALDAMIKAIEGKDERGPQSAGLQAAQNVQYTGYREFGRSLALAATLAAPQGATPEKKQEDYLRDMLANLQAIREGKFYDGLLRPLGEMLNKLGLAIVQGLKTGVYEGVGAVAAASGGAFGPGGGGLLPGAARLAGVELPRRP